MTFDNAMMGLFLIVLTLGIFVFIAIFKKGSQTKGDTESVSNGDLEPKIETPKELNKVAEVKVQKPEKTFKDALLSTRSSFLTKFTDIFKNGQLESVPMDEIEEALYMSDLGPKTVEHLMESISEKLNRKEKCDFEKLKGVLKEEMKGMMDKVYDLKVASAMPLDLELIENVRQGHKPQVWMVVGVNGVGKTTTIGKLAAQSAGHGHRVLVAAGDTFRAAAGAQLKVWTERAQVEIFDPPGDAKPSGVAFDACKKAVSEKYDHLIVDTAGRLHTQQNLMEELKKVKRVLDKAFPGAPHETLLVLDANSGQNALIQAKEFHEALQVSGVILTKLDGSGKGGVAIGLAHDLKLKVRAVGIGEKVGDLKPFSPTEFVESIF